MYDGYIAPIMEERQRQMVLWLTITGKAIYGSHQNDAITPGPTFTAFAPFRPSPRGFQELISSVQLTWRAGGVVWEPEDEEGKGGEAK
ncbi:hypothetical protein O3P69_002043 [Scylla paramamosain]|uniref:Uncharacterized protein n=1 Tax=Scylla paramamosain TaxID=85552 RepID=A0AAW0V6K9_SCYPA